MGLIARVAVAAEDRMQAFLWRHLVPAEELAAVVQGPFNQAVPKRVRPASQTATAPQPRPPGGGRQAEIHQAAGRRPPAAIQLLYEEWRSPTSSTTARSPSAKRAVSGGEVVRAIPNRWLRGPAPRFCQDSSLILGSSTFTASSPGGRGLTWRFACSELVNCMLAASHWSFSPGSLIATTPSMAISVNGPP